jgi:hypothetical protein
MVGRIIQGVTQECCECEVADEPVVVSKARPMKASNGVEGKTKPTISIMFDGVNLSQKVLIDCEGGKYSLSV